MGSLFADVSRKLMVVLRPSKIESYFKHKPIGRPRGSVLYLAVLLSALDHGASQNFPKKLI